MAKDSVPPIKQRRPAQLMELNVAPANTGSSNTQPQAMSKASLLGANQQAVCPQQLCRWDQETGMGQYVLVQTETLLDLPW